jgi:hypothetical protein
VALLAEVPAGAGRPMVFPVDGFADRSDRDEGHSYLVRAGRTTSEDVLSRRVRELMARPRHGGGQFVKAVRDGLGRRTRTPHPVTYLDIRGVGRYVITRRVGSGGGDWITIAPVTRGGLAATLRDLPV